MPNAKVRYVGLDVHKDAIVIAVADGGRGAAREIGEFPSDGQSLHKPLKRLAQGDTLVICYEAGPTGFELHRRLVEAGDACHVVAPSLIPSKPGERIKTDRRDALKRARCLRAGDLTPGYVPDEETEALRDLERARTAAEITAKHQLGKFVGPRRRILRPSRSLPRGRTSHPDRTVPAAARPPLGRRLERDAQTPGLDSRAGVRPRGAAARAAE